MFAGSGKKRDFHFATTSSFKGQGWRNYLINRPFRKSYYLLIGERTRTRAHSRRKFSSEAQPSTLFLHPRAANEEPDKVKRQVFDSPPCHRAVAPPAGPNDEADLCVMRHKLKNLSFNSEGTFAGNGKKRFYHVQIKHRGWMPPRTCVCVFVLLWANSMIFKRTVDKILAYVTPVLTQSIYYFALYLLDCWIIGIYIYLRYVYFIMISYGIQYEGILDFNQVGTLLRR